MVYDDKDYLRPEDRIRIENGYDFPNKKVVSDWIFQKSRLHKAILPSSYEEIGDGAFFESNLVSFEAKEGLARIGNSAFSGCGQLTNLVIPKSVKKIGSGAFKNCFSLTQVVILGDLEECGKDIFEKCINLNSLTCNIKQLENAMMWISACPELKKIKFVDDFGKVEATYGLKQIRNALKDKSSSAPKKRKVLIDYDEGFDAEAHYHNEPQLSR